MRQPLVQQCEGCGPRHRRDDTRAGRLALRLLPPFIAQLGAGESGLHELAHEHSDVLLGQVLRAVPWQRDFHGAALEVLVAGLAGGGLHEAMGQ